ncbi:transposase [Thermoanaerobacter siderophilus]|uniref:transposase n=1 Tax=Thermoanaerobacter siderophilus TaxID=106578 RepID=UPI0012FB3FC6
MYGNPTTISNITDEVVEDIEKWNKRSAKMKHVALYLDGLYVKLRRLDVDSENIYSYWRYLYGHSIICYSCSYSITTLYGKAGRT